ncbi:MAG: lipoyl(octanoyl) transferase LipB, partial [Pseudomonadota bacterium]|nr:lipoyl(octanoyl) transferase LipB [Pseudomonadota bacterium]
MQAFTAGRTPDTADEFWLVEHPPVFTQGLAGRPEHLLRPGDIPVIHVDRGGQVTYHGPGQALLYFLVDLRRARLGPRRLVSLVEQCVVDCLAGYGIAAAPRPDAPGVYVEGAKIASLGLRVRRGCAYHGVAFNVAMDLEPFSRINPCGYPGLRMTQLRDLGVEVDLARAADDLLHSAVKIFGYTNLSTAAGLPPYPALGAG